ncbi:MAG: 50S ribosomal protein L6 [Infirmifilum sp.]|uniref:Large ribosomal subunit protein uL6 n=1 Tax=Infirmifilum uzonense TaxID=1550241 RepID=A0A0F7FHZ0_9CREN|nr:50S ribosomal protein L6 [Infirmifilum uzonense]AKG38977.1 50S ribosomal protein L6 [Infirmifilum uzonense]
MVKVFQVEERVPVPENVKVSINNKRVVVEGPLGRTEKDFSFAKKIEITYEDNQVKIEAFLANKREYSLVKTIAAHINNMIVGVTKGFRYKMKIVYAHFPMNIKVDKDKVIIENFLGERGKRYAEILPGVKVKVEKEDIIIEGIDKEAVAQTAARIHQATQLRGDRRPSPHGREGTGPGVLDGIYLYAVEHMKA